MTPRTSPRPRTVRPRRLGPDPKLARIEALHLVDSRRERDEIGRLGDQVTVPAGTVLMKAGEVGAEAFLLLEGEVAVERDEQVVAVLGAGSVVGEQALLEGNRYRNATVVALTEVTTLVFDARTYRSLAQRPGLATALVPAGR